MKRGYLLFVSFLNKKLLIDTDYIFKGTFLLTISKFIAAFCTLATSIAFANYLPEESYGVFRYALSFFVILSIFTLSGMDTAVVRAVAKGFDGTLWVAFIKKAQFGLTASLFSLIIAGYYFFHNNTTLGLIFILGAIFVPAMEALYVYVAYLNGKRDFLNTVKYLSITRIISATLLVFTALVTQNIITIVGVYLASHFVFRLIFFIFSIKKYPLTKAVDSESIQFGKHLTITQGITQIAGTLDKILVFNFVGGAVLAGYYLALVPFKQTNNLLGGLSTLALPKMAKLDILEMHKILPSLLIKLYIIILPIIVSYWMLADLIFKLLLRPYLEYSSLSKFVILLLLLYPISFLQTALTSIGAKKELYQITFITSLIRITLLLIAVPLYGMWGAVAVVFVTPTLNSILTMIVYIRHIQESGRKTLSI